MRHLSQTYCPICGSSGQAAHTDLHDHLFGSPGVWGMRRCSSNQCGAYWGDPVPHPDDLPLAYRSYYTHSSQGSVNSGTRRQLRNAISQISLGYPSHTTWQMHFANLLVHVLPERHEAALYAYFYLPWQNGGRLLEIGCGAGEQLEVLKNAGWDTRGVDFDPAAAGAARARGLVVDVGDLRSLHYPAASFDAIVMAHVIEHVYDPVGLLRECRRLLKPGGRLVAITPNADSLGHRLYGKAWRGLEPPRHIVVFSPRALRLAARSAGLEVQHLRITARDAANLLLASERIAAARGDEQIQRPQIGQRPPLRLRGLAAIERLAGYFGLHWGEELVLLAYKKTGP